MMLGMCVLGVVFREFHTLILGGGFAAAWDDHVLLAAFAMAFNMTVPMVLWMRYRGHSWERGGEMALAMNLPLLAALVLLYSLDLIPAQAVLGLQMMLMIPAMVLAMLYRKEEYSAPHRTAWHPHRRWFAGAH
jgi:amino acid transporter